MAENKKSFILYADLISVIKKLVEKDRENKTNYAGELFLHILEYVNDNNPVPVDFIVEMSFEPIKLQLKRDLVKWVEFREKQSENGKKGGRPTKATDKIENPKNPSLNSETQKSLNVTATATVNDTVTVNEIKKEDSVVAPQPPKKSISDLEKEFYDMLLPFVEKFGKEMCRKFFNHWSEPNKSKTKLKWQMEKTWDTQKRLLKWESNGFDKPKGSYQQNTGNAATGFQMRNPHPKDLKD